MLISPYKKSSLDISSALPSLISNGKKYYLTVPSKNWYRVYELPAMKILFDSVVFDGKIRAIT